MTSVPIIVPFYAAILALIFLLLSIRVGSMRGQTNIWIGTASNPVLERRMRVQANFAEYVPFTLLLLAFLEMQQHSRYLIHILCAGLLIARAVHAYGVSQNNENVIWRMIGVALTVIVILVAAVLLFINGLRAVAI